MRKDDSKIINAWCSYDIANSAYNLVITATIFPIYYQEVTSATFNNGIITILNFHLKNTVIYDYTLALAYFFIILLSPILSGIADFAGYKKTFMKIFTCMGGLSCILLYWFSGNNVLYGLLLAGIAVIGYAGSLVFYNSFLPVIASKSNQDKISARGFAFGYFGSVILLISLLLFITFYKYFGIASSLKAIRIAFPIVGVWWIAIAQIAFHYLDEEKKSQNASFRILSKGYREILSVVKDIIHQSVHKYFLASFFLFSLGVQTILLVATLFGKAEIGMTSNQLIFIIILIQLIAIIGSIAFSKVSVKKGNKFSLSIMLILWIIVCLWATVITTSIQFYLLAAIVGFIMGGIQSQARSTYSKLIPSEKDTASYFSFYDITEKASIVCGMFLFGLIEHYSGNMRLSILMLAIFFIISLILIQFAKFSILDKKPKA
jgi:UMF1 family MFS transporter